MYMDKTASRSLVEILRWIISILVIIVLAIFFVWSFGKSVTIDGNSMSNTLQNGDTVLVNRVGYRFFGIDRFDIVYFNHSYSNVSSVKRVVGLPGERIRINNGKVWINDEPIELPSYMGTYNVAGIAEENITLADNEYFMLGDNGDSSEDSRFYSVGVIKKDNIIGKVWFKTSPFGFIKNGGDK